MAAITQSQLEKPESWRDNIRITRSGVIAVLFILLGVWMVTGALSMDTATQTRLTFGSGIPDVTVSTQPYTLIVGVLYAVIGAVSLIGVGGKRARTIALYGGGILLIPTVLIVAAANNSINVTVMLQVSLRLSTPIVMGALAGIWCERAGVVNIAIEGMMLTGACFGFTVFTLLLGSMTTPQAQFVGVIVATLSGTVMALLHGWLSITFKTNQIVSGTVINILAVGVTSFVRRDVLLSSEAARETLQAVPIPLLADIPVLGPVLFNGRPIFYSMFILLFATHIILFHTRWGLRTRAVGENPKAADTLGINVNRNRWINVLIGGSIAGLAGAWFSMETSGSFDDNMTSGRGFIALAAMIFGKWLPFGAFGGGLLFGFSDALGQRFQFLGVPVPPQFLQMVPYFITIVVLAGLVGRAVGPKAAGEPYEKEGK
jgi:ABC-type uncharacterized transport system permease subunit